MTLDLSAGKRPSPAAPGHRVVVVHEIVHLIEPHHTPAFWMRLERAMPDFALRKRALAEKGNAPACSERRTGRGGLTSSRIEAFRPASDSSASFSLGIVVPHGTLSSTDLPSR